MKVIDMSNIHLFDRNSQPYLNPALLVLSVTLLHFMVVRINFIVKTDQVQNLERTSYITNSIKQAWNWRNTQLTTEKSVVTVNPNVRLLRKLWSLQQSSSTINSVRDNLHKNKIEKKIKKYIL